MTEEYQKVNSKHEWQAVLNDNSLTKGKIALTAILSDENGTQLTSAVCEAEC